MNSECTFCGEQAPAPESFEDLPVQLEVCFERLVGTVRCLGLSKRDAAIRIRQLADLLDEQCEERKRSRNA